MHSALLLSLAPAFLSFAPQVVGGVDEDRVSPRQDLAKQDPSSIGPEDLGGELYDPNDPPVVSLGLGGPNTFIYQLNLPYRRWKEEFVVVLPDPVFPPPQSYPVLTLFHGSYETPLALENIPLVDAAANRGWLVIIPLGAHTLNYGIDYAQDNIEDVFAWVKAAALDPQSPLSGYHMDLERVYAVGFSMGGGAAASYAARHLDPDHVRFAAIVNHTGSTSLRDTYVAGGPATSNILGSPLMFGGPPSSAPFRYQRSSAIDLRPGNIVDPETDMVRNLVHVPVYHFSTSNDPVPYLVAQSYQMHLRLLLWGGQSVWDSVTTPAPTHSWSTLPITVLDWLAQRSLQPLTEGVPIPVLADRNGRWHFLDVVQQRDKRMSPFTVEWSSGSNSVSLTDVDNVASLGFDVTQPELRLSNQDVLRVNLRTRTLAPLDVVLRGYSAPPLSVQRGLLGNANATWDAQAQTLTLHELDGVFGAVWSITP